MKALERKLAQLVYINHPPNILQTIPEIAAIIEGWYLQKNKNLEYVALLKNEIFILEVLDFIDENPNDSNAVKVLHFLSGIL